MDLRLLAALRTPDGEALLDAAGGLLETHDDLATLTRLRRGWPPPLAAAAVSQARLRQRAIPKFGADAARMFFTSDGLEQATRPSVAALRAGRYAASGAGRVLDLCCGIGADAVALAAAGLAVIGVDRDPLTAAICRANAEILGRPDVRIDVRINVADAAVVSLNGWPAAFCDPARRRGERRVFDPAAYSPPWSFLLRLAETVPLTGLKVAPGLEHRLVPAAAEAEWVSDGGAVTECALWFGGLASGVRHRATLLPGGHSVTGSPGGDPPVGPVGSWLYEPDGAVIRAGLVAAVVTEVGGRLLDPTIAYVTADQWRPTPFATAYEVLAVAPFGLKRLRAMLRARSVGAVTVKKRGTAVRPEELRSALRLRGTESATVVLTRIAGVQSMLICAPPPAGQSSAEDSD